MKQFLTLTLLIFISACKTTSGPSAPEFKNERILLLPLQFTQAQKDFSLSNFQRNLSEFSITHLSPKTFSSAEIPSIQKNLSHQNLLIDGRINTKEAARITRLADATRAICIRVIKSSNYPPQQLAVQICLLSLIKGNTEIHYSSLNINLASEQRQKELNYFIKNNKVGGYSGIGADEKYFFNSARLSNDTFSRFCAALCIDKIISLEKGN